MAEFNVIENLAHSLVEQAKENYPHDLDLQLEALRIYANQLGDEIYNKAEDILLIRPTS